MARRAYGLHKVGKYWHVDFWVDKTTHIHRSTGHTDEEAATNRAKDWFTEAKCKAQGLPYDSKILCKVLFDLWLAWALVNHSPAHCDRVKADWDNHITPLVGDREARTLRDSDAEKIRTTFLANPSRRNEHYECAQHKPRTEEGANKVMRHLRLVFRWGVKPAGKLARVPFDVRIVEPDEKAKSFLQQHQIAPFLAAVDTGTSLHLKVAVRLMLYLGLREHEALALRWDGFTPDLAEVRPHGKTGNAPPLPVHPDLRTWLEKLPEDRKGLVLPQKSGQPHAKRYTVKAIERGAFNVGLAGRLSPHRMRDSYATLLAQTGTQAHVLQKALRHDLLETSQAYVHLNTGDIRAAQEKVFGKESQHTHKLLKKYAVKILDGKLNK